MILPGAGEAIALQRRLPGPSDPLDLYNALSDGGRREDMMLFEHEQGPSLLMERAAVRAECRGAEVMLTALSGGGRLLLARLAQVTAERVVERGEARLILAFPPVVAKDPEERLLAPAPIDALRALLRTGSLSPEEPFTIAMLGVVAFDHAVLAEQLPDNEADPLGFPDYLFWIAETLILFELGAAPRLICTAFGSDDEAAARRAYHDAADRLTDLLRRCEAAGPAPRPQRPGTPAEPEVDLDDAAYCQVVADLREEIAAGEIYQIVPSRTFRAPCPDPIAAYASLRALEPGAFRFYLAGAGSILLGASPEVSVRLFRQDNARTVEVRPIAGTRGRGASPDEDDRLEAEMRLDGKELAEHMMLVDLARNDVARIAVTGTRRVARLMSVERHARVMHLVSSVTGTLRAGLDALHALAACLNVGTLTGAPKLRATELLRRAERDKRGPYGGAVGWLNGADRMETAVVIRSAVVRDGVAWVRAGAGVVYDSDPQAEADETRRKAAALLSILAGAAR